MTVLIALKDEKGIHLAADSQTTQGNKKFSRTKRSKIITKKFKIVDGYGEIIDKDQMYIGIAGYTFLNEYLHYGLDFPDMKENEKFEEYLSRKLLPKITKKLTDNQLVQVDSQEIDTESLFMIIYNDKIYYISSNLSFCGLEEDYCCFGSGDEVALGVLYATRNNPNSFKRCKLAIEACNYHTCYVHQGIGRGPLLRPV